MYTENEQKFADEYLTYCEKYGKNMPVRERENLSALRISLGITLKRSVEITNEIDNGCRTPKDETDETSLDIHTDAAKTFAKICFNGICATNNNYNISEYFEECKKQNKTPLVPHSTASHIANIVANEGLIPIFYTDEELAELPNNHIVEAFYQKLGRWFKPSDGDCTYAINFGEGLRSTIRSNYGIDLDETILFERDTSFWSNNNQGLVITDWGFYCIPDNDNSSSRYSFSWKDFSEVRYKELTFYFYEGKNRIATLFWKNFYKGIEESVMKDLGPKLATVLTEIANLAPADIDPLDLANEERYDEALELANANIENAPDDWYGHFAKGRILYLMESSKENPDQENVELAQSELNKSLKLYDDKDKDVLLGIYANLGFVNNLAGNIYLARNCYISSLEYCDDDESRDNINHFLSNAEETLKDTWDHYTQVYEYKERKFIMPIKDGEIGGCCADGIDVFRMSNIPSCFAFPMGHPVANQLYIGHPYNPSLYVPFEASEDLFFIDKVHELCYLLECLGAEEISITSIKGKSVAEFNEYNINTGANGDVKLFSGEVERSKNNLTNNEYSSNQQRAIKIKLDPLKMPYVPEGLIWYNEQPQWQRLVNSRLNGNMLEYNEFVSNSQTKFTTSTEIQDIKASAKYLWTKVHGEVETNEKVQFKEAEETQWKVEVRFRSIKEFSDNNKGGKKQPDNNNLDLGQLSEAENSYAEEVRFCLSEGEIGDREHRFLNRIRLKLGLSEEKAAQIEEMLSRPQLSDNENEYLEAVKDEITDSIIPEKSKKLLNRLRASLDISIERAKELENMALKG